MQLLRLAITFLTLATATATSAQNGYVINGTVIDVTAPTDPKFSSDPRIVLTILQFEKQRSNPTTDTLLAEQLLVSVNDNQHTFKRTLVPLTRWTRTYAYLDVWFDNGDYVPVDLVSHHRQLPAEVASDGKVTMALKFIPRKNLAISRQTESIRSLDKSNLGPGDFERSDGLARTAIELDPTIDRFLNLFVITSKANRSGYFKMLETLYRIEDLNSLTGFEELSFSERWRLQLELLIMLSSVKDPSTPIGLGSTASSAAIAVGQAMIEHLQDDADYEDIPVILLFRTLSGLHTRQDDCASLIDSNETALTFADEASMNWRTERLFLLEWSDCVMIRSGVGDGRSEEAFLADAAKAAPLAREWCRFQAAATLRQNEFLYPGGAEDARLKDAYQMAEDINQRSVCP